MFAGKSWVIIRSQQSAKLCQSFWTHGEVQVSIEAFLCIYECQAYFGEWLIWAITTHRDPQHKCQNVRNSYGMIWENLRGEILNLSLGTSADSITSTPSNTHTTICRGPAVWEY